MFYINFISHGRKKEKVLKCFNAVFFESVLVSIIFYTKCINV